MTTTETTAPLATKRQWYGLAILTAAVSIMLINGTVVAVLLPVIIADLSMTLTQAQWANAAFTLVFAALLLPAGWLGDRFGQRRILTIGLLVFLVGVVAAGTVQTGEAFIAARLVQGAGAAMISPSSLSVINSTFRGKDRVIAFAVWGAAMGAAAAVGPLLGGWVTEAWDWRVAFLINIPLTAVVLLGIWKFVDRDKPSGDVRGLDVLGVLLSAASLSLIVFGLIEGYNYGWITPAQAVDFLWITWPADAPVSIIPFLLGAGLLLGWLFVRHETRRAEAGRAPLADLRLFRYPSFRRGNVTLLIATLGQAGLFFTLPLFCQIVLGFDTLETGWAFASLAVGAVVSAALAPRLAPRFGLRVLIVGGMFVAGIALGALALLLSPEVTFAAMAPLLFVYGLGIGLTTAQLTSVILAEIPRTESGQASALQSTARQLGSSMGTAVLGTILAVVLTSQVSSALEGVSGLPDEAVNPIAEAVAESGGTAIVTIRDADAAQAFAGNPAEPLVQPVIDASIAGYTDATKITLLVGALIILLGGAAAVRLPKLDYP